MIAVSTAWNAARHVGWVPAAKELLDDGVARIALDGPALQADAAEAGVAVRAARGTLVALFAPQAAGADPVASAGTSLADVRLERRANAVLAARAAGHAALAAGTTLVVLRAGSIPTVESAREDAWNERLGSGADAEALRADVAAVSESFRRDRSRYLEALCRSVWELARSLPDVVWCVETPSAVGGLPFPDEIDAFLGELRGRRVGYWHDAAHAARLGALGAAEPRAWIAHAGGATLGVTVSDWAPPVLRGTGGRTPPGAGIVDWLRLREQLVAGMERVLRLPPEFPRSMLPEALRSSERLTAG